MRVSVYDSAEAEKMVNDFVNGRDDVVVEERPASCSAFPCPVGLESWSGETSGVYVYDINTGEELFAVAYWI
jgi:hypothetical protein